MKDGVLHLAFAGDVALGGEFIARHRPVGEPLTYPFKALEATLDNVDVLLINLEGPLAKSGSPREGSASLLHNSPDLLDWLARFPRCVCSLANNHCMDYGAEGLTETCRLLAERGILYIGAGRDADEAQMELRFTAKGVNIAVLAFTTDETHVRSVLAAPNGPGSCGLPSEDSVVARVSALAESADIVLVLTHWGMEFYSFPSPWHIRLARSLAAAGATVVAGHHPHVPQGIERINGALLCYSLGNLILPETRTVSGRLQYRKSATKEFAVLHADMARTGLIEHRVEGGRCDRQYGLVPYAGRAAEQFASKMNALSAALAREDYDQFWREYDIRRGRQLKRESVRDAVAKLFRTDIKTLVKTVSVSDVHRNAVRIFSGGPKQ